MNTKGTSPRASKGAGAPASAQAAAKRSRGAYRRQLTAAGTGPASAGADTKRAAAAILEVLAGVCTPTAAAAALGIRLPRYYVLEERAIAGLVAACAPRAKGRTVTTDRRLAQLERELATTRRELARQQALARTSRRALGLTAPAAAPAPPAGKTQGSSSRPARRRRKPAPRGLRAARLLCAGESAGADAPRVVQPADGSPTAVEAAGGGSRPAATESTRVETRAEHGGEQHASRPQAALD
jgi:hypothetical protein